MTRRGDASDVAAPAGTDAGLDRGDLRVAHGTGDGFDGGPAQQPRALLGDVAALGVGVGLAVDAGSARPTSTTGAGCRTGSTSPISATNTAASTGPTPRNACTAS